MSQRRANHDDPGYLRERLIVFAKTMLYAFLALRAAEFLLYRTYLGIWPNHYWTIVAIGGVNLVVLASAWQVLTRASLSWRALATIDLWIMAACGTMFGLTALLASNRPESAYTCLVYACFMVFMRTIVVPSTGQRTVIVSTIAMFPLVIAAGYLGILDEQDVPGPGYVAGGAMYAIVAVAVAGAGSRVIYGLRRRVSALVREELELGQYTLVRKLGEGRLGDVFVARHALLRRPTAIKLVAPSRVGEATVTRCERAVQEMSQLRHYNTVAVYDYGRSPDGDFYFAMEYLEGISLDVLVDRYGAQPPARVIAIMLQLCAALHEAHERGFAHGNIKLSNVILCERGGLHDVAKLTDFGFSPAAATAADDLQALRTLAGQLLGDTAAGSIVDCFAEGSAKQVTAALRAIKDGGWTAEHARNWWSEYRKTSARFLQVPTTLAVDLGRRAVGG